MALRRVDPDGPQEPLLVRALDAATSAPLSAVAATAAASTRSSTDGERPEA